VNLTPDGRLPSPERPNPENLIDQNIGELKIALQKLDGIVPPELVRPPVESGAPPTNELVAWTVRVYAYTVVCHFRELLRATLVLVETDHVSAVFPCCRGLFELAAHTYYVKKHVLQHLKNKDLNSALIFLYDVQLASREMRKRQKTGSFQNLESDYPEGPHIAKVMACFNEYFPDGQKEKPATIAYSALSEFSHPNFFAFITHFEREADLRDMPTVIFGKPSRNLLRLCLPAAAIAVLALLATVGHLVQVVRDEELATAMYEAMGEVLKIAKVGRE
jgi:hypothetical protein